MEDFLPSIWNNVTTYEIDSAAATITLAFNPGEFFIVLHLWLQAEAATDVQVRSGSTDLSGPIAFAINSEKEWKSAPFPVFKSRASGDDFVIANSTPAQLNGFVVIARGQK